MCANSSVGYAPSKLSCLSAPSHLSSYMYPQLAQHNPLLQVETGIWNYFDQAVHHPKVWRRDAAAHFPKCLIYSIFV